MSGLEEFGRRVAEQQDRLSPGDEVIADARAGFLAASRDAVRRPAWPRVVFGGMAVGAAAAAAMFLFVLGGDLTVTAADTGRELEVGEWVNSPEEESLPLLFSDGSVVELKPRTGARVVELGDRGARVLLERGGARVDVVHRDATRWRLDVGPFEVAVTGTAFDVSWDPGAQIFSLELEEGSVVVTGPMVDEGRRISSGEVITAWVSKGRLELSERGSGEEIASASEAREAPGETVVEGVGDLAEEARPEEPSSAVEDPSGRSSRAGDTVPEKDQGGVAMDGRSAPAPAAAEVEDWISLARAARYSEATEAARAAGLDEVLMEGSARDLLALGDAARLSRSYEEADRIYNGVRGRFAGTVHSASAALALGRMAFDQQHMYSKAALWLDVYVEENPSGKLVREALGRLVEARQRAGDATGARRAAMRYLEAYPEGPHADYARKLLDSPGGDPDAYTR